MRRLRWLLAAAVAAALVPAPAAGAAQGSDEEVTIRGGGWGHGIGMSQYGAYGRALNGRGARKILEKYYSGARVRRREMPRRIRVGLLQGRERIAITSSAYGDGGGRVVWKVAGEPGRIARGGSRARWQVRPTATGSMRLYKNGARVVDDGRNVFGSPDRALILKYERFGTLVRVVQKSNDYAYGRMEFGTYSSSDCASYCLNLVVKLPMQEYLYGLGEVPSSWPGAVLRAQAIAGRTYAYEKVLRLGQDRHPCSCAVYDSTIDQAYIGDAKRTGSGRYWDDWVAAVDATRDRVVVHRGDPIQALYSSSSGGHTEHNENVWGGAPIPYLRGVSDAPDSVSANPNHTWSVTMSWSSFSSKLASRFGTGEVRRFRLVRPFGVSGRVTVVKSPTEGGVRIVGADKTVRADGWDIRSALGLRDTLFRVSVASAPAREAAPTWRDVGGGGLLIYSGEGGVQEVRGPFLRALRRAGGPDGPLGPPLAAPQPSGLAPGGTLQRFAGGTVYLTGTGAVALWGEIDRRYRAAGGAASACGAPRWQRGRRAAFEGGEVDLTAPGAACF